jgi:hypothetical protein
MVTLGEIFRRYGPQYRTQFGAHMSCEQHQAMRAIEACRTEALGGHVYTCPACATIRYSYHSCRKRHCPMCQHHATQTWLERQQALLLPVPYFLLTFTLPAGLRAVTYRHQRTIYALLFRASAAALQQLARDPRFVGGQIGMIGVLQTWTRDLRYHPHVHYLVPAIALTEDGTLRQPRNPAFLVAAKLQAALRQTDLYRHIPRQTWQQPWVVDCRPVGSGAAALKYLAPYIFRVALSNNRIVGVQDNRVTFRYRDGDTKQIRTCTLPARAFIGRFLQHILPHGFVKVRYYGLFRLGNRHVLEQARAALAPPEQAGTSMASASSQVAEPAPSAVLRCPSCGQPMQLMQIIPRQSRAPPREA